MTKHYKLGEDSRKILIKVSKELRGIVGKTLGPSGRNYFIPTGITNDGRTILENCRYKDPAEDAASLAFNEIAIRTDLDGGDGTTTATVIGTQLTEDLLDKVRDIDTPTPNSIPVMELSRQLDEEKDKVIKLLEDKGQPVDTLEKLEYIALTAMEDTEGAKLVAEAIWEAGKDTFPILENGLNGKIEKDIIDGVSYPFKIANKSFFDDPSRKEAEFQNCAILVVNHAFEEYAELSNFMLSLVKDKPKIGGLVIVANHFSIPFLRHVSEIKKKMGFSIVPVECKNIHNDTYQDLASLVDAHFIDTHPQGSKSISDLVYRDSGLASKVVARDKETIFIGGRGKEAILPIAGADGKYKTRVQKRVEDIKADMKKEKNKKEKDHMELRAAALEGGIATIYVDAQTDAKKYYLKLKVQDAMNSCRNALGEGMVRGGGLALKEVAEELGEDSLMYNALIAPYDQIQKNHGETLKIGKNVLDSLTVIKSAIKNAVSVAGILVSVEGIISDEEPSMVESLKEAIHSE